VVRGLRFPVIARFTMPVRVAMPTPVVGHKSRVEPLIRGPVTGWIV
jgi:hypothetical protein